MLENKFISSVLSKVSDKRAQKEIRAELEAHLLDKADYYIELGYDESEAMARATEEMGDPDDTALPLGALHGKREKLLLIVISLAVELGIAAVAVFLGAKFSYASSYYLGVYHSIGIDFLSLAIIAAFTVLVALGVKKRSGFVLQSVLWSLVVLLIISFFQSGFSNNSRAPLFQPAVYSIISIAKNGFLGYIDHVFSYMYTPGSMKTALDYGSLAVFVMLLAPTCAGIIIIRRKAKMRSTKKAERVFSVIRRIFSLFLAADCALMLTATTIATVNLPSKRAAVIAERNEMIEKVISSNPTDFSGFALLKDGYTKFEYSDSSESMTVDAGSYVWMPETYYRSNSNNCLITSTVDDGEWSSAMWGFSRTDYNAPFDAIDNYIVDEKRLLDGSHENLQSFLDEGFYNKAALISHTRNVSYDRTTADDIITFFFSTGITDGNGISFKASYKIGGKRPDNSDFLFWGTNMGGYKEASQSELGKEYQNYDNQ